MSNLYILKRELIFKEPHELIILSLIWCFYIFHSARYRNKTAVDNRTCRVVSGIDFYHYDDVIMGTVASQITSLTIVYSTIYCDTDQRKHQSSASLAFVWGIHRGPVNSPHKGPVTRKMLPFDVVIMIEQIFVSLTGKINLQYRADTLIPPFSQLEKRMYLSQRIYIEGQISQLEIKNDV